MPGQTLHTHLHRPCYSSDSYFQKCFIIVRLLYSYIFLEIGNSPSRPWFLQDKHTCYCFDRFLFFMGHEGLYLASLLFTLTYITRQNKKGIINWRGSFYGLGGWQGHKMMWMALKRSTYITYFYLYVYILVWLWNLWVM